jgi:hypothetical protein
MAFFITDTIAGTQQIADTSTTQKHPLGTIVRAKDPTYGEGEFIYLLGVTGTTVGAFVTYNVGTGHQTALSTSVVGVSNPIAVAMSANVGSAYGWYQISGLAIGSTAGAASFAATAAFAVAAGEMIVAATTNRLGGAVVAVANPSTTTLLTVNVLLDRPHTGGGEA